MYVFFVCSKKLFKQLFNTVLPGYTWFQVLCTAVVKYQNLLFSIFVFFCLLKKIVFFFFFKHFFVSLLCLGFFIFVSFSLHFFLSFFFSFFLFFSLSLSLLLFAFLSSFLSLYLSHTLSLPSSLFSLDGLFVPDLTFLFCPLSLSCQMKIVSFCNSIPSSYCYNF